MKKVILFSTLSAIALLFVVVFSSQQYKPRKSDAIFTQGIRGAIEFMQKIKANQLTGTVDLIDVENARNQINKLALNKTQANLNLAWQEMGPDNVAGRTRAFMLDKDSINVMYSGGVAGGLWKSWDGGVTWRVLFDDKEVNSISCITQAKNGDIYVGTGEGHYFIAGYGSGGSIGSGIYKSTDRGANWTQLISTIPSASNSVSSAFAYVNELASSPLDPLRIYASTNKGLKVSNDGGQTWFNPINTSDSANVNDDVQVASNGRVITSLGNDCYISQTGDDGTFTNLSTGVSGKLPNTNVSRVELAFSPQDPNYIYACIASSANDLLGVYKTTNGGSFWSNIASALADPLGGQGDYDNCITVSSQNKDKIFVGGVILYSCLFNSTMTAPLWTRIGVPFPGSSNLQHYLHSDLHVLISDPTNAQTLYVGCDGGLFKSSNLLTSDVGGPSFVNLNKGYNVTQFYAISPTSNGGVVGGTQDNGSKYINFQGGTTQSATTIGGGDGGYTEASFIYPTTFFSTVYYGALNRSFTASSGNSFYSKRIESLPKFQEDDFASFITPIALYENFYDKLSPDSIKYVVKATDNTAIGGILSIRSRVAGLNSITKKYFNDTNKVARAVGDTIKVLDILQSRIAVGFNNSIWMTKQAIDESGPVNWMRIGYNLLSDPQSRYFGMAKILRFSKDGDYLYVGTFDGNLFRFSNLKSITYEDTLTGEIGNPACQIQCKKIFNLPGRALCGIAIDPNNNDKVIATFGNYGNSNYVYLSSNATASSPSFVSIQNNLPTMPVYDAIIDMNNTNNIILGTEFGIWSSDVNGGSWSPSSSFPRVPVFCLRQQLYAPSAEISNSGSIFAGTHGRGIWLTNSLVGIKNNYSSKSGNEVTVRVSPNPTKDIATVEFYSDLVGSATIKIYSLKGELVRTMEIENILQGKNNFKFSVENFDAGTYLISIKTGSKQSTAKIIVMK